MRKPPGVGCSDTDRSYSVPTNHSNHTLCGNPRGVGRANHRAFPVFSPSMFCVENYAETPPGGILNGINDIPPITQFTIYAETPRG